MKRGARDSQVVNNFFSLATIIMVSIVLVLYIKYIANDENKNPKKQIVKLECEKEEYTYSKVFSKKYLEKSLKILNKGDYILSGAFIELENEKSNIKNIITLDEIDKFYEASIGIKNNLENKEKTKSNFLKIQYEIIENDNTIKNQDAKMNSGSVKSSFIFNSKEVFRVYTDFTFMYKNAIKQRVDCSIKVFKNHVQK